MEEETECRYLVWLDTKLEINLDEVGVSGENLIKPCSNFPGEILISIPRIAESNSCCGAARTRGLL